MSTQEVAAHDPDDSGATDSQEQIRMDESRVTISDQANVGKLVIIRSVFGPVHVGTDTGKPRQVSRLARLGLRSRALERRTMLRALIAGGLHASVGELSALEPVRSRTEEMLETGNPVPEILEEWDRTIHLHALGYATAPPHAYLRELLTDTVDLQDLLESCRFPQVQKRILGLLSRLSGMIAVVADDLGQPPESRKWMRVARRMAGEVGDSELYAWTLARSGFFALHYSGSASQAIELAKGAIDVAPRGSSAALTMGYTVESRAQAALGLSKESVTALELAHEVQGKTALRSSTGLFDWTEKQAALSRGITLTELGETSKAMIAQDSALGMFEPSEWLDPALVRLNRAKLLVCRVDIDEGCRLAATVLESVPAQHRSALLTSWADDVVSNIPIRSQNSPNAKHLLEIRRNSGTSRSNR